jgi:uncharacterized protein DUF5372
LYQQEFELVSYRQNWGEDRVWFQDKKDDRLHSLPRNWTDLAGLDPFVAVAAGRTIQFIHPHNRTSRLTTRLPSQISAQTDLHE